MNWELLILCAITAAATTALLLITRERRNERKRFREHHRECVKRAFQSGLQQGAQNLFETLKANNFLPSEMRCEIQFANSPEEAKERAEEFLAASDAEFLRWIHVKPDEPQRKAGG